MYLDERFDIKGEQEFVSNSVQDYKRFYITLPLEVLNDKNLTANAKHVLSLVVQNRGDFEVTFKWLMDRTGWKRTKLSISLQNLRENGYCHWEHLKDRPGGYFMGYVYQFYTVPETNHYGDQHEYVSQKTRRQIKDKINELKRENQSKDQIAETIYNTIAKPVKRDNPSGYIKNPTYNKTVERKPDNNIKRKPFFTGLIEDTTNLFNSIFNVKSEDILNVKTEDIIRPEPMISPKYVEEQKKVEVEVIVEEQKKVEVVQNQPQLKNKIPIISKETTTNNIASELPLYTNLANKINKNNIDNNIDEHVIVKDLVAKHRIFLRERYQGNEQIYNLEAFINSFVDKCFKLPSVQASNIDWKDFRNIHFKASNLMSDKAINEYLPELTKKDFEKRVKLWAYLAAKCEVIDKECIFLDRLRVKKFAHLDSEAISEPFIQVKFIDGRGNPEHCKFIGKLPENYSAICESKYTELNTEIIKFLKKLDITYDKFFPKDLDGQRLKQRDNDGNLIPELDSEGNIVHDKNGNVVYKNVLSVMELCSQFFN